MQRPIAREVGRRLRSGIDDARLRQRLETRIYRTFTDEIRDPGRWILGVGLPHWGCGIFDCVTGVLWSSGRRCSGCDEIVWDRRRSTAEHGTSTPAVPCSRCVECGCVLVLNRA
ncbi:hypothetical protein ACFWNR_18200 [Streptomyces virginiae]|uniref:hypothetical protein n=1 Tax=Streptomyces virginiae TaxID=1961 RepID=UPI003659DFB6